MRVAILKIFDFFDDDFFMVLVWNDRRWLGVGRYIRVILFTFGFEFFRLSVYFVFWMKLW